MQINQELSISSNNLLIRDRLSLKKPRIIANPVDENENHNIYIKFSNMIYLQLLWNMNFSY